MFNAKVTLHNRFDFEIIDAITGKVKQRATSYNIVLNAMYTRLINRQTHAQAIHLGSGTGTLDPARTSLFTFVVGRTGTLDSTSMSIDNAYRRIRIQLAPEEYVGTTFTEVGVAYGTSSTNLVTHSTLRDSEGNPISITKSEVDILVVYATLFFTFTLPDNVHFCYSSPTGIATTNNSLLNYLVNDTTSISGTIRVSDIAADISDTYLYRAVNGGKTASVTASLSADAGTKRINAAVTRFSVSNGNLDIQEISLLESFNFGIIGDIYTGTTYTDVPLSGQNGTQTLFKLPSNNIDASSLVVKVNGVDASYEIIDVPYFTQINDDANTAGIYGSRYPIGYNVYNNIFYATTNSSDPLRFSVNTPGTRAMKNTSFNTSIGSIGYTFVSDNYILRLNNLYTRTGSLIKSFSIPNWTDYCQGVIFPSETRLAISCSVNSPLITHICEKDETGEWNITANLPSVGVYSDFSPEYFNGRMYAVTPDSNTIVMIGRVTPYVRSYTFNGTSWEEDVFVDLTSYTARLNSVSISPNGTQLLLNSRLNNPRNQLFTRVGNTWVRDNTLPAVNCLGTTFLDEDTIVGMTQQASPVTTMTLIKRIGGVWIDLTPLDPCPISLSYSYTIASATLTPFDRYLAIHYVGAKDVNTGTSAAFIYSCDKTMKIAKLASAPGAVDSVTASYMVNGIHKTSNYVLDVGGYIQFGEG